MSILTKPEIAKLVEAIREAMTTILVSREGDGYLGRVARGLIEDIGNNGAACILALLDAELPEVTEDQLRSARCAVWANQSPEDRIKTGFAGVSSSWLSQLERTIVAGTADQALEALEARLLALFLATHRLRKLPAACQYEHLVLEDEKGLRCARCGERMEQ